MTKQEFIDSLRTPTSEPSKYVLETEMDNGDKIYVTNVRYLENNEVFYYETRFVVIGDETPDEKVYKLK